MAPLGGSVAPIRSLYIGPGDILGGARVAWSLRAFTSASVGSNIIRLRRDGASPAEQDFATIAGGGLDLASIISFKGSDNLFVPKVYDQSGNGLDLVQTSASIQPAFTLSILGSLPAVDTTGFGSTSNVALVTVSHGGLTFPFSVSHVFNETGSTEGFTQTDGVFRSTVSNRSGVVDNARIFCGVDGTDFSYTDNAWHAVQETFNGASSEAMVDGTANAQTLSTYSGGAAFYSILQYGGGGIPWIGYFQEYILWNNYAFTSGNKTSLNSNQHAYFGF